MQTGTHKRYVSMTLATSLAVALAFGIVSACTSQQAKAKPNFVQKEAPKAGIVAKINGEEITEDALMGEDKVEFFDLKKREKDFLDSLSDEELADLCNPFKIFSL